METWTTLAALRATTAEPPTLRSINDADLPDA
jgi:hypothetical protein